LDNLSAKDIKLKYNKDLDELTVISDKPLFKITPDRSERNKYSSGMFIPLAEILKRFGSAKIECWFSEINGTTEVYCEINSLKETSIIGRIFTRIIVFVLKSQNKEDVVRYKKYVESSA
jgi:hypothetical protein